MNRAEFSAIIADIEKHLEGEGYEIVVVTNRIFYVGGWQWVTSSDQPLNIIVLSRGDSPPAYIPLSSIQSIQLSPR